MIYRIFKKSLDANPQALAVVTSDKTQYTYAEVDIQIKKIAAYLLDCGLTKGQAVGVYMQDEDWHVFVYLALDLLQITYVPFDKDTTSYQIEKAQEQLHLSHIITDETHSFKKTSIPLNASCLTHPLSYVEEVAQSYTSYILGSSGSTGLSKWIPVESDGLLYWADILKNNLNSTTQKRVLCTRSPAYDARIFEYLTAFATHGCLYLLDAVSRKELDVIVEACTTHAITNLLLIASQLNHTRVDSLLATLKKAQLTDLFVTGDACSPHLASLCEVLNINLWNCYGPTEATFGMSMLCVNNLARDNNIVPIGKPILPVKAHLIEGEIYIESPFLSPKGYLCADNDTNEKAFPTLRIDGELKRVFRPGDTFHYLENGLLAFDGRANEESHAKVSGVKISPFGIEHCLNNYKTNAIQAVVVIKSWLGKDKPFAYLVMNQPIDKTDFILYLKKHLKKEEIPLVIVLSHFPMLNPSQKIDKQALIKRQDSSGCFFFNNTDELTAKASQGIYYEALHTLWTKLFKLPSIHPDRDFLLLGGDSLLATELCAHIQETISPTFRYRDLLVLPVISINALDAFLSEKSPIAQNQALIKPLHVMDAKKTNTLFFLPALLGEGYFSYKHLAPKIAKCMEVNVYGLTDPGVFDAKQLPSSLEQAATRYLNAIKRIQPKGPYQLLGFSFGCTLAYQVAQLLEAEGECVEKLHLLDDFPPYLYQQLNKAGHAQLLNALIHFVIQTLNNRYYNQELKPTFYKGLDEVTPLQQLDVTFNHLLSELKPKSKAFEEARCLLLLARRHLSFMQTAVLPAQKLRVWPVLYLSDSTQPYLSTINTIATLSRRSADQHYFYWNRYCHNLRRNGTELKAQHIELLQDHPLEPTKSVGEYFSLSHDFLFNSPVDRYALTPYYQLDNETLTLFFLKGSGQAYYEQQLTELGVSFTSFFLHQTSHTNNKYQKDTIYSNVLCISASIPPEKHAATHDFLNNQGIKPQPLRDIEAVLEPSLTPGVMPVVVHLNIMLPSLVLFSLDLVVYLSHLPLIKKSCGTCFTENNALYYIYTPESMFCDMKTITHEAQSWLCAVFLALKPCLTPTYTQSPRFFSTNKLTALIKKYELSDGTQPSLERALRMAATNNQLKDLAVLISLVHNINASDTNPLVKKTALHWAAIKGHHACFRLLTSHGARDDILDAEGKMAVDYVFETVKRLHV